MSGWCEWHKVRFEKACETCLIDLLEGKAREYEKSAVDYRDDDRLLSEIYAAEARDMRMMVAEAGQRAAAEQGEPKE